MKVVLLAGGLGTRISEESHLKPKPMIEIAGKPILWHIMKIFSYYGFNDFIICAGYKQNVIKEWFRNYYLYNSDITFDFNQGDERTIHNSELEPWKVTIVDTGLYTATGARIKRVASYIGDSSFFMTYGDGVADINLNKLLDFHRKSGKLATLTAVLPESRYGVLGMEGDQVTSFREKNYRDVGWINAGFMILEPAVLDYIEGDVMFEREPLEQIAADGQLMAFKHRGFWQCMDTLRDKEKLEALLTTGSAPWEMWNNTENKPVY